MKAVEKKKPEKKTETKWTFKKQIVGRHIVIGERPKPGEYWYCPLHGLVKVLSVRNDTIEVIVRTYYGETAKTQGLTRKGNTDDRMRSISRNLYRNKGDDKIACN